jgi:hypothetical protein
MADALGAAPAAAPISDALPVGSDTAPAPNAINNGGGPANVDPARRPRRQSRPRSTTRSTARPPRSTPRTRARLRRWKDAGSEDGRDLVRDDKTGKFAPKDPAAKDVPEAPAARPGADPAKVSRRQPRSLRPRRNPRRSIQTHPNTQHPRASPRMPGPSGTPLRSRSRPRWRAWSASSPRGSRSTRRALRSSTPSKSSARCNRGGTDLKTALTRYVNLENVPRQTR